MAFSRSVFAREGEAPLGQIGIDLGIEGQFGVVQQRHPALREVNAPGQQVEIELCAFGRHVARKTQREGCRPQLHARRVVLRSG